MQIINHIIPFGSPDLHQPEILPISKILKLDKKIINLVGTDHTKDPSNYQINKIEELFTAFVKSFSPERSIVIIDGRFSNIPEDISKEVCIENYGEQGYIGYLARKFKIDYKSIEPSFDVIIKIAYEDLKIMPEYLAAWSLLNFLSYFIQSDNTFPDNSLEKIENVIRSFLKNYGLTGDVSSIFRSISRIIKLETDISFPETINGFANFSITKDELRMSQEPNTIGTTMQRIGAELNRARDYGIFKNTIKLHDKEYDNIFAVFGWNHVLSESPAFREIGYIEKPATQ